MNLALPEPLQALLTQAPELARAYLVGGGVRDALLGRPSKDLDVEVFGLDYERLERVLERFGRVDLVGRSFGVIKLTLPDGTIHDFSLPRRDSKRGAGHRGFDVAVEPDLPLREAARRDFTINALMYDPRRGEVLDFFGGRSDLEQRVLRHTSAAFVEDPLRVLRGMQFAARFRLRAAPETLALCREIAGTFGELATERVREEWFKWAARASEPSAGLAFLADAGWLGHFPEIAALRGVAQDSEWHREGDAWIHTGHSLDALVTLPAWREAEAETRTVFSLAVLLHDTGKAFTTRVEQRDGRRRIVSPGHETQSVTLAERFLERLQAPLSVTAHVLPLVAQHMAHLETPTDRAVRRLARRLAPETIAGLCTVMTADAMGRPPLDARAPAAVETLLRQSEELRLRDCAPRPILLGRHLLALGLAPGPEMGALLARAFEAQLDGAFADLPGAHRWLAEDPGASPPLRAAAAVAVTGPEPPPS